MRTCFVFALLTFFSNSVLSQNSGYFDISTTVDVQFIVTDPMGRRTGEDPRGVSNPMQGIEINEISGANYSTSSVGDSPLPDYESLKSDFSFEFNYIINVPQNDGVYTIQTIGTTSSDYNMDIHVKSDPKSTLQSFDINIHGVTDVNKVATYRFTYHGMPGGEIKFEKVVTGNTLLEDISAMRKVNWISTQEVTDKYTGFFTAFNTQIQQNNFSGARTTLNTVIQNLVADSTAAITSDAYKSLRLDTDQLLAQLPPPGLIVKLVNSTGTKLTGGALQYYEGSWKDAVNNNDGTFFVNTTKTSLSLRMTYAYGTQTKSNVTVGYDTVVFQTVNAQIQLQNSNSVLIDTGSVQYYAGAWRVLGTTINGTATKELLPANYSFRMTYASASKDKQQDISTNATVIFQTVNTAVQLQNSQGALMPAPLGDQGTVQYYSGAWRNLGTTSNGVVKKELLPNNYSFRMSYAYASKDKQQDISTNATIVFQTVNAVVQLQNSQGTLIDQGTVQYYSGAWRDLGTTTNGVANKELLPNNYSFRMTYAYASKDKQQDIGTNATVVFQTVNAAVQLKNSLGNLIDQGTVQYYSGAWRDLGTTTNGIVNKELLPNNYSFRMTYAYASKDKQQDITSNATVVFQTVNATVQLQNSQGNFIDQGTVQYYSGAWRTLGTTTNGTATKELLPNNYSFRMTYEYVSVDKSQDLSANSTVGFSTVLCTIRVKNSQNQLVNNALASYYSGAWRQIGNTVNGEITKELLPVNLSFRVKYGTQQQDKQQNLSTNNIVEFTLP